MEQDEYFRMAAAGRQHWWYAATRRLIADILAPELPEGARVLDVGCGTGAAGGWLAARGPVVGVDASSTALALYHRERPHTALAAGLAQNLPFRDAAFDAALCVTVLYHEWVRDPVAAVREITRTLRPGGVACFVEPGMRSLRRAHDRVTHGARRFSRSDLGQIIEQGGLTLRRCTGAYSFLAAPAWVQARIEGASASHSDLDRADRGLAGLLPALAACERRWLRHHDLPLGLSVLALARRPV